MVDTAFDDFLDSDDDAFFLEASSHLQDCDLISESTQTKETNASQRQSTVIESSLQSITVNQLQSGSSVVNQNNVSGTSKISLNENIPKNINVDTIPEVTFVHSNRDDEVFSTESGQVKDEITITVSAEYNPTIADCNRISSKECKSINIEVTTSESLSECITPIISPNLNKSSTTAVSSYINSRFTPGFTPKAKKRKLPGPAGFLELIDKSKQTVPANSPKMMSMDMEFENVVSSQYTPEHLSLSSWQKLQTAVSSCSNLHSTAKYYSIQRVLQESSKKKLPKHMVVPVLCVLLKKLNNKGSATLTVFMDDTGEINGKIDTEVLSTYEEFLIEGTALILKKVTFLCNVLILKAQNIVSMYHPDGTEKHPQSLESSLEISQPLKPMNCECLKMSHVKNSAHKISHLNASNNHTSSCITHSQYRLNNISNSIKTIPQNNSISNGYKSTCNNSQMQSKINYVSNQNKNLNENVSSSKECAISEASYSKSVRSEASCSKNLRSDAFLENLLDEDNCMDEFDELLGNLDEKSFMDDV